MSALRLPYFDLSPKLLDGFRKVKKSLETSELGQKMVEMIFLRTSQINGCSFCLNQHSKTLRSIGESDDRLAELAGWRVSGKFDAREKAALAWCEAVTDISITHAEDEVYEPLKAHFTDIEISDLTFAISLMNGMNRLAISMRQ